MYKKLYEMSKLVIRETTQLRLKSYQRTFAIKNREQLNDTHLINFHVENYYNKNESTKMKFNAHFFINSIWLFPFLSPFPLLFSRLFLLLMVLALVEWMTSFLLYLQVPPSRIYTSYPPHISFSYQISCLHLLWGTFECLNGYIMRSYEKQGGEGNKVIFLGK